MCRYMQMYIAHAYSSKSSNLFWCSCIHSKIVLPTYWDVRSLNELVNTRHSLPKFCGSCKLSKIALFLSFLSLTQTHTHTHIEAFKNSTQEKDHKGFHPFHFIPRINIFEYGACSYN